MTARYRFLPQEDRIERARRARQLSSPCSLCPRCCGVDRAGGEAGFCGAADVILVSSANLHHGEEPPVSGSRGSGTIFFSGCNLRCRFCQNYPISQLRHGRPRTARELADAMLRLERRGAHNINLVTPSHATWPFLEALALAAADGLTIPIVYNSSGYDSLSALRLLDGIVDVYLPDLKYADDRDAIGCSGAVGYWEVATRAILEMHRQVGDLVVDETGVAVRGLVVRHLVLPGGLAGTERVLAFVAERLGRTTAISLMRQYFPAHLAVSDPVLGRAVTDAEFERARQALDRLELDRGWIQDG